MTGARMDMDRLQALEAEGYLRLRAEPGGGLLLANYTPRAQHGRAWDLHPELLLCRGTALGPDGTIAGRPFRKFFAMGERPGEDPASLAALGPPEATEKLDGSMVARWQDPRTGRWRCTTRGSWDSAQALAAAALLDDPGRDTRADPGLTYIYEYTGPDNRVVLRYAESRATLIGAAETAGPTPTVYPYRPPPTARDMAIRWTATFGDPSPLAGPRALILTTAGYGQLYGVLAGPGGRGPEVTGVYKGYGAFVLGWDSTDGHYQATGTLSPDGARADATWTGPGDSSGTLALARA